MEYIFDKKFKLPINLFILFFIGTIFFVTKHFFLFGVCSITTMVNLSHYIMLISKFKHSTLILNKHRIKYVSFEESFSISWKKVKFSSFINIGKEVTWTIGTKYGIYSIHLDNFNYERIEKMAHEYLDSQIFKDESIKSCGNYTLLLQ